MGNEVLKLRLYLAECVEAVAVGTVVKRGVIDPQSGDEFWLMELSPLKLPGVTARTRYLIIGRGSGIPLRDLDEGLNFIGVNFFWTPGEEKLRDLSIFPGYQTHIAKGSAQVLERRE